MKSGISTLKMLGVAAVLALPGIAMTNEAPATAEEQTQQTTQEKPAETKEPQGDAKESK